MPETLSLYPHIKDSKNSVDISFEEFLKGIGSGRWQDLVLPLRTIADKKQRTAVKMQLPYVTVSGTFSTRNNNGLIKHSGLLAVDIDEQDPEEIKDKLRNDSYVRAMFTSCSGTGLCVIFRVHPHKHLESFEGIAEYLYGKYKIIIDQACKDLSRPRYVSYDPDIYLNDKAYEFKELGRKKPGPKKEKPERAVVYIQSEFDLIIDSIDERGVDIVPTYAQWVKVGYALAHQFKEQGRAYFHIVSRQATTYTPESCDKQYDAILRVIQPTGGGVTIASFYWICKEAGIAIASETVANISRRAATHKRAHSTPAQTIQDLYERPEEGSTPELIQEIVKQVYEKDIKIDEVSDIEAGRIWVRNSGLRRNGITGQLHLTGGALTNPELEGIELRMREDMPDIDHTTVSMLLKSDVVPKFHEIFDFFKKYHDRTGTGSIKRLADTLNSPTGDGTDYVERMLTKWIVGGIACLFDDESHTMLVLCGEKHGDGKSFFFKNFLPPELRHLCACKDFSGLSNESTKRDFEISITRSWLIFDDEMGGKSKRDHRLIKAMLAKSYTDVRAAYAKTEEHRKRISFFGGTSNDLGIISDHGDNRRIIPIQILPEGIDQKAKDAIDPIDYIMEAWHLYKAGYDYRILSSEIDFLNAHTALFKEETLESDLIAKHFKKPEPGCGEYLTGTDVKIILESGMKDKVNPGKIKHAMKELGIYQEFARVGGVPGRYYYLCRLGLDFGINKPFTREKDDDPELLLPF